MQLQRILLRSVNWLGDAVMTLPAVQRLKQAHPAAHITVLTEPKLADLWRLHPDVDQVLVQEKVNSLPADWRLAGELRRRRFDAAIVFPNSWRSALPAWLAGVPRRIGFRGHARGWMLTAALAESRHYRTQPAIPHADIPRLDAGGTPEVYRGYRHQAHRHLELAVRLGADPTPCAPRLRVETGAAADSPLPDDRPLVALNAGAEYGPAKCWLEDRFIAAARAVAQAEVIRWVIIGGPQQAGAGNRIAAALGGDCAISLAGQTTLRGLCRLLARCRALLTNDSGPMHLAAALGTPVVAIFGSTEPALTGPTAAGDGPHVILRHQPLCSPCFLRECPIDFRCMKSVTVEEVVDAVRRVLKSRGA
jgi:heptosyltransferase-2